MITTGLRLTSSFFRDLFLLPALPIASIRASKARFRAEHFDRRKGDQTCSRRYHDNRHTQRLVILIRLFCLSLIFLILTQIPIVSVGINTPLVMLSTRIGRRRRPRTLLFTHRHVLVVFVFVLCTGRSLFRADIFAFRVVVRGVPVSCAR